MADKPDILSPQSSADVPISDLSHLYEARDPRTYYTALGKLDYQTPDHIQNLARQCLDYRHDESSQPWVIDIGCGYGANGAGLLYNVTIESLLRRYDNRKMDILAPDDVIEQDTLHFVLGSRTRYRVAGLDVSRNALDYGLSTGVLDVAFDEDLTQVAVPDRLVGILESGALILESGVPIFVLPKVLGALLGACGMGAKPWVITAPPRYTNLNVYNDVLKHHGYAMQRVTETPLPHRKFNSPEEGQRIIDQQVEMGVDTSLEKATGYIHIDLYLARPNDDLAFTPVVPV